MYCDYDDIILCYPEQDIIQLSCESGDTADDDVITQAITGANAEIDAHIGKYTLPEDVPALINLLCVELAVLNLYKRRNILTEDLKEKRRWCDDLLKKLSSKQITLPEATENTETIFCGVKISSDAPRGW